MLNVTIMIFARSQLDVEILISGVKLNYVVFAYPDCFTATLVSCLPPRLLRHVPTAVMTTGEQQFGAHKRVLLLNIIN